MTENPICCPICLAHWDFGTDWIGRLTVLHPVGQCVPKPAPVYEVDDEDDDPYIGLPERRCEECRNLFRPRKSNHNAKLCGPECRILRRDRKKSESDARRGKFWALEVMTRLHLPTRPCVECGRLFTQSSKFSCKQMLCSAKCRRVRESRKSQERRERAA